MAYTTIDDPTSFFNTVLYTGSNSSQSITGVGFQPDWVWFKQRGGTTDHKLHDVVRGTNKNITTNNNAAEQTYTYFTSFDSDGFTLEGNVSDYNKDSLTYVAWNWLAGGSASSNSDGGITSSVSANTTAGFSIVSYTGTGSGTTVGHGLGAIPKAYFLKNRASASWVCYFEAIGNTKFLQLDLTNAAGTASEAFNDTSPTSSVFSVGSDTTSNANSNNYIAYVFAEKQGYSKIGSYTGGSDPFVYLGFKPAWIMFKNSSASENWRIIDNKRDTDNPAAQHLYPNLSNAEGSGTSYNDFVDFLSNGFKIRSGSGEIDGSGNTIIFMAFAESPFVNSNGIPNNAR